MSAVEKRRVGGPARGYSREPFESGNEAAAKHGAYSVVAIQGRARELAERVAQLVPVQHTADAVAHDALGVVLARVEAAVRELERAESAGEPWEERAKLEHNLRAWLVQIERWSDRLALNPVARAGLGLTISTAEAARARAGRLDLSRLSDEQLEQLGELVEAAGVIDADDEDDEEDDEEDGDAA